MKSMIVLMLICNITFNFSSAYADSEFLEMLVQGQYILLGKGLESDVTYHGKVEIIKKDNELVVSRIINGETVYGKAAIESAIGGDIKVLRIRFTQNENIYEKTCIVGSDLDNYARISCYLYQPGVQTIQPGLEVLFNDLSAK